PAGETNEVPGGSGSRLGGAVRGRRGNGWPAADERSPRAPCRRRPDRARLRARGRGFHRTNDRLQRTGAHARGGQQRVEVLDLVPSGPVEAVRRAEAKPRAVVAARPRRLRQVVLDEQPTAV